MKLVWMKAIGRSNAVYGKLPQLGRVPHHVASLSTAAPTSRASIDTRTTGDWKENQTYWLIDSGTFINSSTVTMANARRTFFASSTDHTQLLKEAEVHCFDLHEDDDSAKKKYILAANGMDIDTVNTVPQLHLARLLLHEDGKTIFGAKVVNKTLGKHAEVCSKLMDAAMKDIPGSPNAAQARSTLHGLSAWVLKGLSNNKGSIDVLAELSEAELEAVESIAKGGEYLTDSSLYQQGKDGWENLVREYLDKGFGDEATLYQSFKGKLVAVEHHADRTEFATTSGAAMALFSF